MNYDEYENDDVAQVFEALEAQAEREAFEERRARLTAFFLTGAKLAHVTHYDPADWDAHAGEGTFSEQLHREIREAVGDLRRRPFNQETD